MAINNNRSVKKGISIKKSNKPLGKSAGSDASDAASILNTRALLYIARGRYAQAEPLYKRALSINEKAFGSKHPVTALSRSTLASLYALQDRHKEADRLFKRTQAILEKALGSNRLKRGGLLKNAAKRHRKPGRKK
jgi:tetratricopeptide (TPR) repeat protein